MSNKPVIVWNGGRLQEHLRILKDKCIKYERIDDLLEILLNFKPNEAKEKDWKAYQDYSPELVMNKFNSIFLDPVRANKPS